MNDVKCLTRDASDFAARVSGKGPHAPAEHSLALPRGHTLPRASCTAEQLPAPLAPQEDLARRWPCLTLNKLASAAVDVRSAPEDDEVVDLQLRPAAEGEGEGEDMPIEPVE